MINANYEIIIFKKNNYINFYIKHSDGDWGLGIGDWGFGVWGLGPKPKPPTPNPQTPNPKPQKKIK